MKGRGVDGGKVKGGVDEEIKRKRKRERERLMGPSYLRCCMLKLGTYNLIQILYMNDRNLTT